MPKVIKVRYGMTREAKDSNTRFEHDRIDVELELGEGDEFDDVVRQAKALCLLALGHIDKKARELIALMDRMSS